MPPTPQRSSEKSVFQDFASSQQFSSSSEPPGPLFGVASHGCRGSFLAALGCSKRLLFGNIELNGSASLSDIGVTQVSILTVVTGPPLQTATTSGDLTAKLWCATSGECLRTFEGHRALSEVCSVLC